MVSKIPVTDRILRLHTAENGEVWCGCCRIGAMPTGAGPIEFVTGQLLRDADEVRLLGIPANALLITKMFERRTSNPDLLTAKIHVGSPGVCFRRDRLSDPSFVLRQMWQPSCQARVCGCWHELSDKDYTSYYMLGGLQQSGGVVTDMVRKIGPYHPAWSAITFPASADLDAACRLLCLILDPRWYNHVDRPGRASRLFSYLGLSPDNFESFAGALKSSGAARAQLVLQAWKGSSSSDVDLNDPRNFLWRIAMHRGGGTGGLLRASKTYVQLIRLAWLQELASGNQEVFVPEIFFKHECETEAYAEHLFSVKKRL